MKRIFVAVVIILLLSAVQAAEKPGPRVYISVDMEGIWGIVHGNQTSSDSPEYGSARKWMAEDVNAVIAGLFEAGAAEVVVNDSHGSMRNIVADALDPRASLISGTPKPLSMMQGIDSSFDACVFVGYHARAGTAPSVLDHTISGGVVRAIRVNGQEMPELGLNAAIAGYFNVPIIMLTGDTETCAQAKSILGDGLVTVAVKEAQGRYAAKNLPLDEARKRLREGAKEALQKKGKVTAFRLNPPFKFELELNTSAQAELPTLIYLVKRASPRTVEFSSDDYLKGFKLLRALIGLAGISYN
jgi:D-amino peptidase